MAGRPRGAGGAQVMALVLCVAQFEPVPSGAPGAAAGNSLLCRNSRGYHMPRGHREEGTPTEKQYISTRKSNNNLARHGGVGAVGR